MIIQEGCDKVNYFLVYNILMTELNQSYEDGVQSEKARIIELIRGFKVADKNSEQPGNNLIQFPLEDLIALINGE
jgi:hypothetical protein